MYKSALVHGYWEEILENAIPGIRLATKFMHIQNDITLQIGNRIHTAPQGTGFYRDADFPDLFQFDLTDHRSIMANGTA